jgi:hypothetical protein
MMDKSDSNFLFGIRSTLSKPSRLLLWVIFDLATVFLYRRVTNQLRLEHHSRLESLLINDGGPIIVGIPLAWLLGLIGSSSKASVLLALAHTITNKAEAAYRRGDLFEKRRKLMAAWTNYCQTCKVVLFRQAARG